MDVDWEFCYIYICLSLDVGAMLLLIGSEPFLQVTTKLSKTVFCLYGQTVCTYFAYADELFVHILHQFASTVIINLISYVLFRYKHFIAFRSLSGVCPVHALCACLQGTNTDKPLHAIKQFVPSQNT